MYYNYISYTFITTFISLQNLLPDWNHPGYTIKEIALEAINK